MKIFKYVFVAAALGLTVTSCADMDLEPKGLLYDNVLMSSDNGIQKYLALVYQDLPVEDFNYGQSMVMVGDIGPMTVFAILIH